MAILDVELAGDAAYTAQEIMASVNKWEKNPDWDSAIRRLKARKARLLDPAVGKQAKADLGTKVAFSRRNASRLNSFLPGEYVKVKVSQYSAKMHGRIKLRSNGPYRVLQNWGPQLVLEGLERSVPSFLCSRFYHDVCARGEAEEETGDDAGGEEGTGDSGGNGERAGAAVTADHGGGGGRRRRRARQLAPTESPRRNVEGLTPLQRRLIKGERYCPPPPGATE